MKNLRLLALIAYYILSLALVPGCKKTNDDPKPEPEPDVPTFSFDINASNGERTIDEVIKTPKATLSIKCDDDATNFVLEYSINGAGKKRVNKLWPGKDYSFNSALSSATDYGTYTIEGVLYEENDPEKFLVVEKELWMQYKEANIVNVSAISALRDDVIGDEISLYEEEIGSFQVLYQPDDTYLNIKASSSNATALKLDTDKMTNKDGLYTIPFVALSRGISELNLEFINGADTTSQTINVKVVEDKEGKSYELLAECDELSIPGHDVSVAATVIGGKEGQLFDVDYFVDEVSIKKDVKLTADQIIPTTIHANNLSAGEHSLKVRICQSDNPTYYKEKELRFTYVTPRLMIRRGDESILLSNGESGVVEALQEYTLSVDGAPDKFASCFELSSVNEEDIISGRWPWSFKSFKNGYGDIKLNILLGEGHSVEYAFGILRKDVCELSLEYVYTKDPDKGEHSLVDCAMYLSVDTQRHSNKVFDVWASVSFYGLCEYIEGNRIEKEGFPENTEKQSETSVQTKYFQIGQAIPERIEFADLLSTASAVEDMYIESEYWRVDEEGTVTTDRMIGKFYYMFLVSKVKFNITTKEGSSDGLSYIINVKGLPTAIFESTAGNIVFVNK